jgi:hypothetical protein
LYLALIEADLRSKTAKGALFNGGEEKEQKEPMIHEEDEYGNILIYPNWSKKNAPKEQQNKWEVPIYM